MKQPKLKADSSVSRREFLGKSALVMAGFAIGSRQVYGAPAILKNLGKPNSKFNGVQLGTITYSFRSLPGNAEQVLKYCLDANVSAIEYDSGGLCGRSPFFH